MANPGNMFQIPSGDTENPDRSLRWIVSPHLTSSESTLGPSEDIAPEIPCIASEGEAEVAASPYKLVPAVVAVVLGEPGHLLPNLPAMADHNAANLDRRSLRHYHCQLPRLQRISHPVSAVAPARSPNPSVPRRSHGRLAGRHPHHSRRRSLETR